MNDIRRLEDIALNMRKNAIEIGYLAGKAGAHYGAGLSCIEILAALYGKGVKTYREYREDRDRILISKAHGVLAYYTALYEAGLITKEELFSFEKEGSEFIGHPKKNIEKGIEYAGGSLGMALSVGCGMAYYAKVNQKQYKIYVLLGDGECEEGSVWEAMMFASAHQLENLVVIIDRNQLQYDGTTFDVLRLDNFKAKGEAFGFDTIEVDGHNLPELSDALDVKAIGKPKLIIANTIKGKGISFMENNAKWHHGQMTPDEYRQALEEVGANLCKK